MRTSDGLEASTIRGGAVVGATVAAIATAAVGAVALLGVPRIPLGEYLLLPGSLAAWLYKGDNYRSSHQFLAHTVALGVPVNAALGAIAGLLVAFSRRALGRRRAMDRDPS